MHIQVTMSRNNVWTRHAHTYTHTHSDGTDGSDLISTPLGYGKEAELPGENGRTGKEEQAVFPVGD